MFMILAIIAGFAGAFYFHKKQKKLFMFLCLGVAGLLLLYLILVGILVAGIA